MERTEKVLVFSDEYDMETLINIIHDSGIKTNGMTREIIGEFEENVAWGRCKSHEINALVIALLNDDNGVYFHDIDMVENKPLYLYALTIVVDDDDDDTKATEEEEEERGAIKMKCNLVKEEREQIKNALENRIEYLVYALHMDPMCDDVQISIIALDSIGYDDVAERYREQLPEWQDMYDNDKWEDYE